MIKTAVILAAGLGSRLNDRTKTMPKGFLEIDGRTLIGMSIEKLLDAGIEHILIGTGYHQEKYLELETTYPEITCFLNPVYATSGSMHTLYHVKDHVTEDFLLLESDLLYDQSGLQHLIDLAQHDVILSSGFTQSNDEVYIEVDDQLNLKNMSKIRDELSGIYSELVGISKISYDLYKIMCNIYDKLDSRKIEYEQLLVKSAAHTPIYVSKIEDYAWCEIDTEDHFKRAIESVYPIIISKEK